MEDIISTLRIRIEIGKHSFLDRNWGFGNDNEPYARLYYINSGKAYIFKDDLNIKLLPGMLYLIPPYSGFSSGCHDKVEIFWLHFTADFFYSASFFNFVKLRNRLVQQKPEETVAVIKKIIRTYNDNNAGSKLVSKGLLMQLLAGFIEDESSLKSFNLNRFAPLLDYIDKHINRKLKVSELAKKASLERAYFSTLFSKTFGVSLKEYISRKKIEHARFMLMDRNKKVDTVGKELGFIDGFHFSRTFKKYTGSSPREFRLKNPSIIP